MGKAAATDLQLAVVSNNVPKSFQKWLQAQNVKNKEDPVPIPSIYQAIPDDFPNIDIPNFIDPPKHNITHTIDTADKPPCKAKVRQILRGSPKEKKGKQLMEEMEQL